MRVQCKVCGHDNPAEARFCANCGATLVTAGEEATTAMPAPSEAVPEVAVEHAGFWIRLAAAIIDGIAIWVISFVLSRLLFLGMFGHLASFYPSFYGFPLYWLYHWLFTGLKGQTPGKMVVGIKVVDAQGNKVGLGHAALREILGKTISTIVLLLGFLWIGSDDKKQGWHDKIAGTYVVKVVKAESRE